MQYYFLVLLSVIGLAVNFSLTKIYQNKTGTGLRLSVLFNIICGAFTAVAFFLINGFLNGFGFPFTPFSFLMACIMTVLCGTYVILGFKIISMGNIAIYTLFLMLGGMTLPYFYGLFFLNEAQTQTSLLFSGNNVLLFRIIGVVLMIVSVILSAGGENTAEKKKTSRLFILLCILVFCLNGGVSITSKIHQLEVNASRAVTAQGFVFLAAVIKTVIFSVIYLLMRLRDKRLPESERPAPIRLKPGAVGIILASALVDGVSYLLQLIGASHLPASVLYPLVTGGSIILTSLCGRFFFKEKLSRRAVIGIALCFVSTFFFL